MHWEYGMGFGMGWIWIVFLVIITVLALNLLGRQGKNSDTKSALDILKERYAKGEIDKEEFDQKRKDLSET